MSKKLRLAIIMLLCVLTVIGCRKKNEDNENAKQTNPSTMETENASEYYEIGTIEEDVELNEAETEGTMSSETESEENKEQETVPTTEPDQDNQNEEITEPANDSDEYTHSESGDADAGGFEEE